MSSKKPVPGYIWMLAGLAIGLFVAFLMYLDQQRPEELSFTEAVKQELKKARQEKQRQQQAQASSTQASSAQAPSGEGEKPRFEFYTILSELEVLVSESDIGDEPQNTAPLPVDNAAQSQSQKQYLLQAGSFKSNEDAERLKANLALLGVQSNIQKVSINDDNWHRVRIGPFADRQRLRDTLNTLKQNNIHAMTMELK